MSSLDRRLLFFACELRMQTCLVEGTCGGKEKIYRYIFRICFVSDFLMKAIVGRQHWQNWQICLYTIHLADSVNVALWRVIGQRIAYRPPDMKHPSLYRSKRE